ncbi:MAG: N-acyl homoserine lactonase family protein [Gammaproteobacteria bacterium]
MSTPETYQVYAIRYATKADRQRRENFIAADPHEGAMPIDYYVWAIVNPRRTIVVDTGFDHEEGQRRGRVLTRLPREGLAMLGIDSGKVADVVITHLHYDHAGTLTDFPQAHVHVQDREMAYASGRYMRHAPFRHSYSASHVKQMIDRLFDGRLEFHDGDEEIAPGVSVHLIGGHTMGIQCVRVHTQRGWIVLAADASHFYENMEKISPFPIVFSVADMIEGYGKLRRLADSNQHIIPGHDPLVMARYAAPSRELQGIVASLDGEPLVQ